MEINFFITKETIEQMSWEEYEAFERAQEGELQLYRLRPVMARFMTNGNNKLLPRKKAMAMLGELPLSEIQTVLEAFTGAIQDGVIPKENRNPSESPSEVSQADSESPAGLESSSKAEIGSLPPGK